jgi:hypothetical protein
LRSNLGEDEDEDEDEEKQKTPTLALALEIMPPIPSVPANELLNSIVLDTIRNYPHLFQVSSSINILTFCDLLQSHPNQALVESVCNSLQHGFWPQAETAGLNLPETSGDVYLLQDPAHLRIAIT